MDPSIEADPAAVRPRLPSAAPGLGARVRGLIARQRFLLDVLLGASFMVALHLFVVQVSVVKGHSMEPSLFDGDRLVVDRVACSLGDVHRGDVVVLRYPRNPAVDFVKRVVGLPGDRIALRRGQLWVNGEMAPDEWTCIADCDTTRDIVVPRGSYFVLGDNRPISCDSREFGLVPEELLKGRVRARFWPLDRMAMF
ncbi:MAG: signal peptidase I [Planctomycetota bacterium]